MAVRPFYITADIEGRETSLAGGPRSKKGTMRVDIQQRNKGDIETAFTISTNTVEENGVLMLHTIVRDSNGSCIGIHKTEY